MSLSHEMTHSHSIAPCSYNDHLEMIILGWASTDKGADG